MEDFSIQKTGHQGLSIYGQTQRRVLQNRLRIFAETQVKTPPDEIKISCYFDYTKEQNPITVRCFWSRHEFPERGEMYDLEVLFFYKAEKNTGNFVSLGEIKNQQLIKTLPSAIDLRPIRDFKAAYTGWVESQGLFKTAMKTPSPENKKAWDALCKAQLEDPDYWTKARRGIKK